MKIKKAFKYSIAITASLAAAVGTTIASNKLIFKIARKKDRLFAEGHYYDWEHGNVHYIQKGTGKPLLLIHSLTIGSSHREFYKNIDALSKRFTVYAIDLPGYGYSDKPKITYTAFIYASFINKFITEVIKMPCGIVGANGGGMLGIITAKLFPEAITDLALISPTGIHATMAKNSDIYARTVNELPLIGETIYTASVSRNKIKHFLTTEGLFSPDAVTKELLDIFYFSAHGTNTNARYSYASFKSNYMNMDILGYLQHLHQNICIIWGEGNLSNPSKNMDLIKEVYPKATCYLFEETRLFPHIENGDELNRIINTNL